MGAQPVGKMAAHPVRQKGRRRRERDDISFGAQQRQRGQPGFELRVAGIGAQRSTHPRPGRRIAIGRIPRTIAQPITHGRHQADAGAKRLCTNQRL